MPRCRFKRLPENPGYPLGEGLQIIVRFRPDAFAAYSALSARSMDCSTGTSGSSNVNPAETVIFMGG